MCRDHGGDGGGRPAAAARGGARRRLRGRARPPGLAGRATRRGIALGARSLLLGRAAAPQHRHTLAWAPEGCAEGAAHFNRVLARLFVGPPCRPLGEQQRRRQWRGARAPGLDARRSLGRRCRAAAGARGRHRGVAPPGSHGHARVPGRRRECEGLRAARGTHVLPDARPGPSCWWWLDLHGPERFHDQGERTVGGHGLRGETIAGCSWCPRGRDGAAPGSGLRVPRVLGLPEQQRLRHSHGGLETSAASARRAARPPQAAAPRGDGEGRHRSTARPTSTHGRGLLAH
mmetsp:Transcript_171154/g.548603  ORF Transcript_171154/g.548603 Transcript_171154/m.548603 type:complete len:288 (+) Transcript_171154:598-1461(+)